MEEYIAAVLGIVASIVGTLAIMLWNSLRSEMQDLKTKMEQLYKSQREIAILDIKLHRVVKDVDTLQEDIKALQAQQRGCP